MQVVTIKLRSNTFNKKMNKVPNRW